MFIARQAAERQATAEGFTRLAAQEVALIVSELAWNIVRHAGAGRIELQAIADPRHGPGLEIRAWDPRPPIADLALAQRDGHTASGPIPPDAMLRRRGIGCAGAVGPGQGPGRHPLPGPAPPTPGMTIGSRFTRNPNERVQNFRSSRRLRCMSSPSPTTICATAGWMPVMTQRAPSR